MSFGIDFGTTNSSLCFLPTVGSATRRDIGAGDRPFPSVVAINRETGAVLCGIRAWEQRRALEANPVYEFIPSIKTVLGTDWKRLIAGRIWRPWDVAAEVLKAIKAEAVSLLESDVDKALVSIPVGFHSEKRRDLRRAAEAAGITIERFVGESTAAFVESASAMRADTYVVVFDWGGGTLDISILKNSNGTIRELATTGIPLGGDAIDRKLAHHIHSKVANKQNFDCAFEDVPVKDQDRLIVRCEEAKRRLCNEDTASIAMIGYGPFDEFRETIDRYWFADFVRDEIDQAVSALTKALREAHLGAATIDRILVVGGSSKLVSLRERLIREFGEERLVFPFDSEWSVSRGAAKLGDSGIICKSAQDVGIVLSSDEIFPMLRKDSPIDGWEGTWQFGITDTSEEAHLVFTGSDDIDQSPEKYRCVSVPAYRFLQESLIIDAWVDENLVFNATARSDMHPVPANEQPVWKYERLKVYYDLNGGGQR